MIRRTLAGAAFLAAAAAPAVASAQSMAHLGIAAGATVPVGDFGDAVTTGYHAMATLGFSAPLVPVGFRVDGAFNELAGKNSGPKTRVWSVTGNVLLNAGSAVVATPYLIGGGGWYHATLSPAPILGSASDDQFGFNVGAGLRIPLTGFSTFAEVRYHKMLGDAHIQYVPITFGINF